MANQINKKFPSFGRVRGGFLAFAMMLLSANIFAQGGTTGTLTWALSGSSPNYTLTISGSGAMPDYGYSAPWYGYNIATVVIDSGVTSIGNSAFTGCSGLTSVTIGNSVTSIGNYAFSGCSGLTSVTIPNSVTSIGISAFANCTSLQTVNYNAVNCTTMGSSYYPVFYGDTAFATLNIGDSVKTIPGYAFQSWSGLTSVTIPNSVTSIGYNAFNGCSGLTSVTIPNSVTSIGDNAFNGCSSLTSINVDGSNPRYSSNNGILYTNLIDTLICCPEGKIGTLTIPNSVTTIGDVAFRGCSGLTSVTIGNSVTSIGYWAFYGCSSLTSVTIGNSVTSIGDWVFRGCSSLTSLTLPFVGMSDTATGEHALLGILFGTGYDSNMQAVQQYDGFYYYTYSLPKNLNQLVITKKIGERALYNCSMLTSVIIGDSVTSIGNYAFYGCTNLHTVNFNAVNCTTMGSSYYPVFYGDTAFTTLNIGDSVKTIPSYAFTGCSGLTSVTIPNGVTSIGDVAFYGCSGLTSVTIGNSVTSVGYGAFYDCSSLTSVTIPNGVTSIGNYAFTDCSGLTTITIPDSVAFIGDNAFSGCINLQTVNYNAINCIMTNGLNYMNQFYPVFAGCNALDTLNIGNKVQVIPDYSFAACGLTAPIIFPNSVTYIGNSAFRDCSSLTSVTIPNSVTSIGDGAFANCSSLTSVTIPDSVTSIGQGAFMNCGSMTAIHVDSLNNRYSSIGGILYNKMQDTLIQCPGGKTGTVIIPNSVTSIGNYAFYGCSGLTTITIPDSVAFIGDNAFANCTSLQTVNYNAINCIMSNGPDNNNVLRPVFNGCNALDTLNIGNSVKTISDYAFSFCSGLTSVTIGNSVTSIGDLAFYSCSDLTSIISRVIIPPGLGVSVFYDVPKYIPVYVPCQSGNSYKLVPGWYEFVNYINSTTIADTTFYTDSFCYGKSYSDNNFTTPITQGGTYYASFSTSTGCDSIVALTLTVNPLPAVPIISQNGNILTSSSPTDNQWYFNGVPIPSATNQTYICTQDGKYWVEVANQYGCTSLSDSVIVTVTGSTIIYSISGQVIYNGNPLAGVSISCTNGNTTATNSNGEYNITVDSNATVTLIPSLSGYDFTPPTRTYNNVANNIPYQDFTAATSTGSSTKYTISGQVTHNGNPLAGVSISCTNGNITATNSNGEYSITVDSNATVTLIPSLSGYDFTPPSRTYNNVANNIPYQDFTAATSTGSSTQYTISGQVTYNGNPLAGVSISCTNGNTTATNSNGEYNITVDSNATVTLTPNLSGYDFTPPSRTYNNVASNIPYQDFTAATSTGSSTKYTISGQVTYNGNPLAGVSIIATNGLWVLTESNGSYILSVDSNATVTLTPNLSGYDFTPPSRTYTGVTTNIPYQDFIASTVGIVGATQALPLRVYPNPTNGKLHVSTVGRIQYAPTTTTIELFDVVGQVVGAYRIHPEEDEIVIDISHLATGLYFLKVDGKTVKVVKE